MSTEKPLNDQEINEQDDTPDNTDIITEDNANAFDNDIKEKEASNVQLVDDDVDEPETVEMVIELPRDIYTGWILSRITGRWDELTTISKVCLSMGFLSTYAMQFAVFTALIRDLDFNEIAIGDTDDGSGFWFNLCALAVLFIYLWKDVIAFYNSVWFWIGRVEEEQGFSTFSNMTDIKNIKNIKNIGSGIKNIGSGIKDIGSGIKDIGKSDISIDKFNEKTGFCQYRLLLIGVFVLYGGLGLYSVVAIGGSVDLIDKIEVGINIFFILEINEWAASLFVFGPGVLDDHQFDVIVRIIESQEKSEKRVQKRLLATAIIIFASIFAVYIASNYQSYVN